MAMSPGTNTVSAGTMARAIYDEIASELDGYTPDPEAPDELWARLAAAIANGVIAHMIANADLVVQVTTSDGALQRYEGRDTDPPTSTRTIGGSIE
jgi:hypothetical protein